MRILFSTCSAANYMAPPRLSDEQINCGPDWPDKQDAAGRWISMRTPVGQYDIGLVLARLPADQRPDAVACLVDASWRNQPCNLTAFSGPKALLVADTHHMQSPLIGMLRYAADESYTRVILLYDRHHADIFRSAGLGNIHWLPGLTFPHDDATVKSVRAERRAQQIAFVGQAGRFHSRRARLLEALRQRGLPLQAEALDQRAGLASYGRSLLGFNASLNGDLNLRVLETLAGGAALLTDRLSPDAGLEALWHEGRDVITYADADELAERAAHALAYPAETAAIGRAGAGWFDRHYHEARRRELFARVLHDGADAPEFVLGAGKTRVFFPGNLDRLIDAVAVYEGLQELHRGQETVTVGLSPDSPADFEVMCRTLPRVRVSRSATADADLLVTPALGVVEASKGSAARIWCWDATEAQLPELTATVSRGGYVATSAKLAVFCRNTVVTPLSAAVQANQARKHYQCGDYSRALEFGRAALQREPHNLAALTVLADLALLKQGGVLAEKLLRQARAIAPHDADIAAALAEALILLGKDGESEKLLDEALRVDSQNLRALCALAQLHERRGRFADAIETLELAMRLQPDSAATVRRLGIALRRDGRVTEGLEQQRRALGITGEISVVDPSARPVQVALLAQHPQGWTSLESVWRNLEADPDFEVTVVAAPYQHPYPPEGGPEAIYDFLAKQGVPFLRWDARPLAKDFADIVFVQNPYDVTRPVPLRTPNLLKLVPRLAYVPYGLEIGGGEANAANQFNLPLQQHAWLVCARSSRHRAMFERYCAVGATHVAVTGHPRLDALRELAALPPDDEFTAFARGRRIVFWNPQFDIRPDGTGYSTFMLWEKFLIEEFARRPDLAFVIRPHPLFFGTLEARQLWTRAQVDEFLGRVARVGNILIDRRKSYLPVFAASAAMLSDASTFLLEYAGTGKPLLYLHNPRGPSLNEDGEFIRVHSYTAEKKEEIVSFLDMVAAGEDPKAATRRRAYPEVMHLPFDGAGGAVKATLLTRLRAETQQAERRWRQAGREFWSNCTNTHFASSSYYRRAAQELVQRVPRYLEATDRLIDVGCGNGEMTLLLAPHCRQITGFDVSPALVAQAATAARSRSITNAKFEVLDLERGLPAEEADAVLCLGVFACMHADETWRATLDRFAELLPQGGLLVLRETVSPAGRRSRRHAQGYYACYREADDYLATTVAAGFTLIEEALLDTNAEGCTNHLWIFHRNTHAVAVPRHGLQHQSH